MGCAKSNSANFKFLGWSTKLMLTKCCLNFVADPPDTSGHFWDTFSNIMAGFSKNHFVSGFGPFLPYFSTFPSKSGSYVDQKGNICWPEHENSQNIIKSLSNSIYSSSKDLEVAEFHYSGILCPKAGHPGFRPYELRFLPHIRFKKQWI